MGWAQHLSESEQYIDAAENATSQGDLEAASQFYALAALAEESALAILDPGKVRSIGISAVNAASLWYLAKNYEQARRVVNDWLSSDVLPDFARIQMEELLTEVRVAEVSQVTVFHG